MPFGPFDPEVVDQQEDCAGPCPSFLAGHSIHPIQARLLVEKLWGWREATVRFAHGREVILEYPNGSTVALWHHKPVEERMSVGEVVRLHEGLGALALTIRKDGTSRALSVKVVAGGLGSVAEPVIAVIPRRLLAVVDLQTGEAIVEIEPLTTGWAGD